MFGTRPEDWRLLRRILVDASTAALLITAVLALFMLVVILAGGVETSGSYLNWEVVQALASIGAVLATVGALGLLRFTAAQLQLATLQLATQAEQLDAENKQQRIARQPYLRVDIGFEEPAGRSAGFKPRAGAYTFSADEFRMADSLEDLAAVAPVSTFDPSFTFCLWVTNLQQVPVGIAYQITIDLVVGWRDEHNAEGAAPVRVQFAYLEPGQTTGVRIAKVRKGLAWFVGSVQDVGYQDLFGAETLIERHGAQEMLYDHSGVTNDRSAEVRRPEQR